VKFCELELDNKSNGVRIAAIGVFGVLYGQLGPRVKGLLSDSLKPALLSAIDVEFSRVGYDPSSVKSATYNKVSGAGSTGKKV
tara:strand:- start:65 stop:313 length:249 start_codon:yes stop_codon:yes gene_type:complete